MRGTAGFWCASSGDCCFSKVSRLHLFFNASFHPIVLESVGLVVAKNLCQHNPTFSLYGDEWDPGAHSKLHSRSRSCLHFHPEEVEMRSTTIWRAIQSICIPSEMWRSKPNVKALRQFAVDRLRDRYDKDLSLANATHFEMRYALMS